MELVGSRSTQSPAVSQLGRMLSCQMIVSSGWNLQLGDLRGAFLEADALGVFLPEEFQECQMER